MAKDFRKIRNLRRLAVIGGAVATVSAGGLVLIGHAQDKTSTTAIKTPTAPVAYKALPADALAKDAAAQTPTAVAAKPATVSAKNNFRGDLVAGKPVLFRQPMAPSKVQWAAALGQAQKMAPQRKANGLWSRLPKKDLDQTRLPVILPREGGFIQTTKTKLISFGDAYALNMPQDKGVQITMYGNRSFVKADKGAVTARPALKLAGVPEDVRIGKMEDGWTATFTRYGVVYSVDVSCDDINSDDCKTDSYIRNAIAQLDDVTMGSDATSEAKTATAPPATQGSWLDQVSRTIKNLGKGS